MMSCANHREANNNNNNNNNNQQFPGYEMRQHNIIIDALGGVATGDGDYDARDRREQE